MAGMLVLEITPKAWFGSSVTLRMGKQGNGVRPVEW